MIRTYQESDTVAIVRAYVETFAGAPWFEIWDPAIVLRDFQREMEKTEAICMVAEVDATVIGFTWGYRVEVNNEFGLHLQAEGLHQLISGDHFYLDEVAVIPKIQGTGVGKRLVHEIFGQQKVGRKLLRTKRDSRMHKLIMHMGGQVQQEISEGRIIMTLE